MKDYYKDELLLYAESWTVEGIETHIKALEERLEHTKDYIRALRNLRRRKLRNSNLKDTGTRGGM